MVLSDINVYRNVIGGLMQRPNLFYQYQDIVPTDFDIKVIRAIFVVIKRMFENGKEKLIPYDIDQEIANYAASAAVYNDNDGFAFLQESYEYCELENFDYNYRRLKKLSLLRRLDKEKYDISYYYKPQFDTLREEKEAIERFETASIEDILNKIEGNFNIIREEYLTHGCKKSEASAGISELIEEFKNSPNIGAELSGQIFNTLVRGARKGCYYLKSAASGVGKTRSAVFDACHLAYPIHYDTMLNTFVEDITNDGEIVEPTRTLFIVTEMEKSEIQSIILAYISGVNEDHIITDTYSLGEYERVLYAAKIMKQYEGYFFIEEISEPDLVNVEATIKRYATIEGIEAVVFDYVHSTASMMAQFAGMEMREDSVLMIMSNQLKQIAKDYNLFVMSATQVNARGMERDGMFKDENCIRGAKSIADKADAGYVLSTVNQDVWKKILVRVQQYPHLMENIRLHAPTHVLDLYKVRRGKLKRVRIWIYLDLGNGERKDLLITDEDNNILSTPSLYTYSKPCKIEDWRQQI